MNRKGTILTFILLSISIAGLTAHDSVRTAGIMTWEWDSGKDRLSDLSEDDKRMWGFQTEFIHSKMGFGMDGLVDFYTDSLEYSMLDWQGQLFMRYHLFGSHSFLDPFVEAGIGNAGTVRLNDGEDLKLSLYPFVSTGVNLVFHEGFYAGGRWSYRADEWTMPGTTYPVPELGRYQMSFYVGFSYGWDTHHHGHHRHYHYHYD